MRRATQGDATQTTASTSMTLAGALECLSNPEVLEMVCPPTPGSGIYSQGLDDECFDIARFVARNKDTLYRIHGTNEPYTIGQNVSSGCIRMMNEDVTDLYGRVRVGTKVVVM